MKNIIKLLSLFIAVSALLCSCGSEEAEPEKQENGPQVVIDNPKAIPADPVKEPEPVIEPEPEPEIEPEPITYPNPLSGLPMEEDISAKRPYAVMINNHKNAQPLSAVSKADIVYEYIAEGGITRLLAIYQSLDGVGSIGTVRSARPYYLETVLGYDAIYVHAGGSDEAYSDISKWKMDHMDGVRGGADAKIFWREASRKSNGYEHTLMTSAENILSYVNGTNMRKDHGEGYDCGLRFSDTSAAAAGSPAERVTLKISSYKTGIFEYDNESGRYNVSQYGKPMLDEVTNEDKETETVQLSVKNLIVLHTSSKVIDDYGRMSYVTTGSGTANYYCEGRVIPVKWSRKDRNDVFRYYTEDGAELTLMPGNTYICVINKSSSSETAGPAGE